MSKSMKRGFKVVERSSTDVYNGEPGLADGFDPPAVGST